MKIYTKYKAPTRKFGNGYQVRACDDCGLLVAAVRDAQGNEHLCDERTTPPQTPYRPGTHTLHAIVCRKK